MNKKIKKRIIVILGTIIAMIIIILGIKNTKKPKSTSNENYINNNYNYSPILYGVQGWLN